MCKLWRITHKLSKALNIKPFGLYSFCEWFAGVYTSIKSTKLKFIPKILLKQCKLLCHELRCYCAMNWDVIVPWIEMLLCHEFYSTMFTLQISWAQHLINILFIVIYATWHTVFRSTYPPCMCIELLYADWETICMYPRVCPLTHSMSVDIHGACMYVDQHTEYLSSYCMSVSGCA